MFNFLKSKLTNVSVNPESYALVEEFANQEPQNYSYKLENFTAGIQFQSADPRLQLDIVVAMLMWFESDPRSPFNPRDTGRWQLDWKMCKLLSSMLEYKLPFSERDIVAILDWSVTRMKNHTYYRGIPQIIKVVKDYIKKNEMSDSLSKAIDRLTNVIELEYASIEARRWALRLRDLKDDDEIKLPLLRGDIWTDTALSDLRALDSKAQTAWAELLLHCLRVTGSVPSSKWLKGVDK